MLHQCGPIISMALLTHPTTRKSKTRLHHSSMVPGGGFKGPFNRFTITARGENSRDSRYNIFRFDLGQIRRNLFVHSVYFDVSGSEKRIKIERILHSTLFYSRTIKELKAISSLIYLNFVIFLILKM